MSVSGVAPLTGTQSSQHTNSTNPNDIAGNFNTFLSLLTTQLKNQSPLDPLNTNQFTSQLVQFSSVEQQLKTNSFLQTMVQSSQDSASNAAVSYIGKNVTSTGVNSDLKNGAATWSFDLPSAAKVTVTIKDAKGNQVYTDTGAMAAGKGQFNWDGVGTDGTTEPDGTYSVSIDARNANGGYVAASTETTGTVTGVDLSGAEPALMVGNSTIKLSDVTSVRALAS